MKHTLSKTIALVAVSALLLTQVLPLHALPSSADISATGVSDYSNYTPDRGGRAPVGGSGDVQYNAFTFPTFNNYVGLNNLEAQTILVENESFNDLTGLSNFIGDERQFLSARVDLTNSTADDDNVGPGDRTLHPAYDPLLINSNTNTVVSDTVTNKQVRFYLFVHNNGAPPGSPNGGADGIRALDTTVRVQLPQTFEAAPEVTGYISASNAQYYPNMGASNDTITNQNLINTQTVSDSVVVHMTDGGIFTGTEHRIRLNPVAESVEFYEHNATPVPDTNELDFNEPRDLSAGSADFFNPTGSDPLRGMSLSSSQNGTVLSDGTVIGCFQNAGIITFLADIELEDTDPTAPTIQKYVSTAARAVNEGSMPIADVNTAFLDADTAGAAVDFGTQDTGSDYTAHYRVAVTNTSDVDLIDVVVVDTMHLLMGTTETAPRIVDYGTSTALTTGTKLRTYLAESSSESFISQDGLRVDYLSSNTTSSTFNIPTLPANQTIAFYYDALIINPVDEVETHYNEARITTCDDNSPQICGLDSQIDAAFIRAHAEPLIPEVDVEKYITNSSTPVDPDTLVQSIALNNAVNRTNINVYQDADTSTDALEFLTSSPTITSFDASYLVKLQKTPNSTAESRIADIELSDRFYPNQAVYDASSATLPNLVNESIETYYKVSSKNGNTPRYFVVQLGTNSAADPFRITSNTDGTALTFSTPASVELGSYIPLTNAMIAHVATPSGPIALGTSTTETQVLFDGTSYTVEEILFSYHVTVPAPSTVNRQNSFNRISIDSFATFTSANDTTSTDTDVKESDVIVANCTSDTFCDDAHLFTQPKGRPTLNKSVSLTPRATGETGAESFQPADTQGDALNFGIRTSPYITYYRIAVTNTGSTILNDLAIEDEFFLRGTIATAQNVVNSAGTTLVSNTLLPTYTVGSSSGLETAVDLGDRVTYIGLGAISTSIRFEIPTLAPNQTIAFYYNVLVDNTIAGRPATSNHRNESYVCWLPSQNPKICNPGDRDYAFSRDSAGSNDVEITKTVNGVHSVTVANGAALHYVVTTRNTGTTNLTNVQLSDTVASLPNVSGITNIRLIAPGTCATAPGCALANLGTALSAQSFTLIPNQRATLTYDAVGSFTGNGQSAANTNTATVTTNQTAPETATAVVIVTNTIIIEEDLETNFRIRKDASPELVRDGDEVTYTVRVTPRGTNDTIEDLTLLITDDINDDGRLTGPGVTFTYVRNSTRITTSEDADCDGEVNDEDGIRCEDVGPDETIRITYRVRVSAPTLRASDIVNIDNTATLRDDTPDVTIRDEDDAVVQVVGISLPPEPSQPLTILKTVDPGEIKRGEIAHYMIVITNPNPDAETHRVVDTIGLNNGVVPGQTGGLVRFNPDSFQVTGDLYHSGTIGNPEGLTFTIPGNGRVVLTYTATGEPPVGKNIVSIAPNRATLDTGAYSDAFVNLPSAGPADIALVFGGSTLAAIGVMLRRRKKQN